jgi:hypothetical protein
MRRPARPSRFRAVLNTALVLLSLLGFNGATAMANQPAPDSSLDLAAMAPTPADLADERLDGFGMRASRWPSIEEIANENAEILGMDAPDLIDALEETDLVASYDYALDIEEAGDDGASVRTDTVYAYLSEHADADGAQAGFALREDEVRSSDIEDIDDAPEIGDESELTRVAGRQTDGDGLYFVYLDFTFRVDRVYAGVQLIAYAPDENDVKEPRASDVEALATRMLERVEAGLAGDTPELSMRTVRLENGNPPTFIYYDWYEIFEGTVMPYLGQDEEILAPLIEETEEFGITERYRIDQIIQTDEEDPVGYGNPYMVVRVSQFADADAAADWVAGAADRMAENNRYPEIKAIEDLDEIGDSSAAARYAFAIDEETTVTGHVIFVQVDDAAFSLEVDAGDLDGVAELAEIQVACLEDGACAELVPVPDSILSGEESGDDSFNIGRDDD